MNSVENGVSRVLASINGNERDRARLTTPVIRQIDGHSLSTTTDQGWKNDGDAVLLHGEFFTMLLTAKNRNSASIRLLDGGLRQNAP